MNQRDIQIIIENTSAKIVYHSLYDFPVKTLLLTLTSPRRVLNTREGYREVYDVTVIAVKETGGETWAYLTGADELTLKMYRGRGYDNTGTAEHGELSYDYGKYYNKWKDRWLRRDGE